MSRLNKEHAMTTLTLEHSAARESATAKRTHAINWFEIPCENLDRATAFYEDVLGAKMSRENHSPQMSIFSSDPTGTGGMLVKRPYRKPGRGGALVYLNCDGILDAVLERVMRAGGLILMPKTPVPGGHGFFACMRDSEGNHIGLHSH
jgi:predicted enzyme related to lactoylglutathione lyase